MKNKIVQYQEIENIGKFVPKGTKTVLVGGCFDLVHFAHHTFLKNAKNEGDFLIVLLESDEHIKRVKNRIPVHTQQERAEILASLEYVDLVVMLPFFENDSQYKEIVTKISPFVIAVTSGDNYIEKKKEYADAVGGKVIEVISLIPRFATSKIIENLSP